MYAWSFDKYGVYNGEFDTFDEALKDADENGKDGDVIYIGQIERYIPDLSVFDIIKRISDDCYDVVACDTYLTDLTDEEEHSLLTALRGAFLKWAKENGQKPDDIFGVKENTIKRVILWKGSTAKQPCEK